VLLSADDDNFREIGDGGDDSGGELDSLVDLIDLEDVVASLVASFDERLHVEVDFFSSQMNRSSEELEDVTSLFVGCHLPQKIY